MTPELTCIETIRFVNARPENLALHNERMNRTRQKLFSSQNFLDLSELIPVPGTLPHHVHKCRVVYRDRVESVEWEAYEKRTIRSLRVIRDETIDYSFKFRQRHDLDRIYSQKKDCDDVLIVRNGYLTDAYVCNIALWDGAAWLTPADPLLRGTQRALLLQQGTIMESPVLLKDLHKFTRIRLFNAMMPWPEAIELPVAQVFT